MRETSIMGGKLGAVIIEKRRGTVSSVKLGLVDRNPPEGATWAWRFTKTAEVSGTAAKSIASELFAVRGQDNCLAIADAIIARRT